MRIHLVTGLVAGLWLVLMAVTGVLLNHQEELGLVDTLVPNAYLPGHYADEFHPEGTALAVVLTDLHSGRIFGSWWRLLSDVAGLLLLVSVATGFYTYVLKRRKNNGNNYRGGGNNSP